MFTPPSSSYTHTTAPSSFPLIFTKNVFDFDRNKQKKNKNQTCPFVPIALSYFYFLHFHIEFCIVSHIPLNAPTARLHTTTDVQILLDGIRNILFFFSPLILLDSSSIPIFSFYYCLTASISFNFLFFSFFYWSLRRIFIRFIRETNK